MRLISALTISFLLTTTGCGDKKDGAATPSAKPGEGKAGGSGGKKDLGAPTWKKLDKLGLQIEVPASAEFMDTSADAPGGQFFTGNNECSVRVNQTTEAYTDDFNRAKEEAEKDPGKTFVKWVKAEKTADGWHLEWEATSSMDPARKLYPVSIRRKFGDKQVECWESPESAESAACTIKSCQSLKPL